MNGTHVLIVEDDDLLRQSLSEQLSTEGFVVSEAATAAGTLAAAVDGAYEAILLSGTLCDGDGATLCRDLRSRGLSASIIVMAGATSDAAAAAGADNVILKPFRLGHLLALLRANLRQREQHEAASVRIGPYTFQPAERALVDASDHRIALTDKEVAILRYLHRAGRVIAREVLLDAVWGYSPEITTHTLETHVYRLRRKIEADPANARILVTEPGGYRLVP